MKKLKYALYESMGRLRLEMTGAHESQMAKFFEGAPSRSYHKNQLIHYQGDAMTHIYRLKKGFVKAYTILDTGDTRTIFLLSPGDIFPIAFSVATDWQKYRIKYFYQTMSDVELQVIDRDLLAKKLESNIQYMQAYLTYLANTNNAVLNQLEVMKNKRAIDKLEFLLPYLVLKLGKKIGPNRYQLQIKLSHQEIADLSGVTRETTTALIKSLERKKVLKQDDGYWIINGSKLVESPFDEELPKN